MEKKNKKSGHKKLTLDTMANRILVVTLAILMTFQFCTSTFYGVSFAEDNLPQVEDEETGTVEGTDENPADEPGDVVDNHPATQKSKISDIKLVVNLQNYNNITIICCK